MSTVAVKKVDKTLYRKVKALASLRGTTVSEVVNEALDLWVSALRKAPPSLIGSTSKKKHGVTTRRTRVGRLTFLPSTKANLWPSEGDGFSGLSAGQRTHMPWFDAPG